MIGSAAKFVFVLMPFASEFEDVYQIAIKDAGTAVGIRAERLDDQMFSEGILDRIFAQIDLADVIVADMTGRNANVFYEVGYAHGKDKLVILLTKTAEDIPFDLKHRRHIVYGESLTMLRGELERALHWAVKEVEQRVTIGIKIDFDKPVTYLETNDYSATLSVDLTANIVGTMGVDVSSITLYGRSWDVSQNAQACTSGASDVKGFDKRYFLRAPVSRIEKDAWAPLTFRASRTMWNYKRAPENPIRLGMLGMVRIATPRGTFDSRFDFPYLVFEEEIPF